jgi:protein-S-isoprenylcysteine O-methyltransferase Ste14
MKLLDDGMIGAIERQGRWLFHRRSVIGLALVPFFALALWQPGFPAGSLSPAGLDVLSLAGLLLSLAGLMLRAFTVATVPEHTSRRSTRQLSAQTLNTRGMYSLVRHPLYLANAVVATGFALAVGSLWFMAVFQLAHALYIERIMACEDRFVAQTHGADWEAWAAHTPAIVPRHLRWTPPALGWSVRTILRREYNSVCLVTTAFFVLQISRGTLAAHESPGAWLRQNPAWGAIFAAGLLVLLVLRTLKRHTRLLHVPGR